MDGKLINVLASLPDLAVYELNPRGEVAGWSDAARRLLGFDSHEVIGRSLDELQAKALSAAPISTLEEAARHGRSEKFGLVVRKDGSSFWANEVTVPILDPAGQTTGFGRIVRDVTSWKMSQEERDRIFTLSADLICVCGFDGYFKRVNPSFVRVLGYTEAELLAKPFFEFIHPDDIEPTRREVDANTRGEGDCVTQTFSNRFRRVDGTYRWLEWKSSPVPRDGLIYGIARDVTEQRATDERLNQYARELERSNADLQQFAYLASHDLQEPLRAVVGCVQLLADRNRGGLDERSIELMGLATDGAKRMQKLITDLLAYSRAGSKGITKAMVDVRACVDKALRDLSYSLTESQAVITIHDLPNIVADSVQLAQLFQNLIGNAIKFRTGLRPEIHIRVDTVGGQLVFSVADNGIGIAPEFKDKVFGVFQRFHSKRDYSGNGIGLAICKKIVERHGGRIWVESAPGKGSVFSFTLV